MQVQQTTGQENHIQFTGHS